MYLFIGFKFRIEGIQLKKKTTLLLEGRAFKFPEKANMGSNAPFFDWCFHM